MRAHRAPWACTYAEEDRSKCLLGKRPKSDQEYFEILCLCILQAGLNCGAIRKNWPKYRKGFYNFNIKKLANAKSSELIKNSNVIKNPNKIKGIVYNAKEFLKIKKEYSSFSNFLDSSKGLKKKEFHNMLKKKFKSVGDYTAEFYPHCVGL